LVPWWLGGLAVCQIVAKNNRRNPDAGVEGGAPAPRVPFSAPVSAKSKKPQTKFIRAHPLTIAQP
jgi:hypothetical protein